MTSDVTVRGAAEVQRSAAVSGNMGVGGDMAVRGKATFNGGVEVKGWVKAPNIIGPCKGLFGTEEALKSAYPKPKEGWFAGVGDNLPAALWRVEAGEWTAVSGGTFDVTAVIDNVDGVYATEADLEALRDKVYELHYTAAMTATPAVIFNGESTEVTLVVTLKLDGVPETDFDVSAVSGMSGFVKVLDSGATRTFKGNVSASGRAKVTVTKGNYEKEVQAAVKAVDAVYYGQSSSERPNTLEGLSRYGTAVEGAGGRSYQVKMTAGNYFVIAVPSSVTGVTQVGTGGASGFFANLTNVGSTTIDGVIYHFYRTSSPQAAGETEYYVK